MTIIINRMECAEWIAPEEGKAEYVRNGWDTWAFYHRQEAARLMVVRTAHGYHIV